MFGIFSSYTNKINQIRNNSMRKSIGHAYHMNDEINRASHKDVAVQQSLYACIIKRVQQYIYVIINLYICPLLLHSVAFAEGLPVQEIAPGVFAHQGVTGLMTAENKGKIANIGFIVGDESVAVIDTGGSPQEGRDLLAAIRQHTAKPIRWVINTHMHPDHVFGNAAFVGPDVAFIGHAHLAEALDARFAHYLDANRAVMGVVLLDGTVLIKPSISVENQMTIDLGHRLLEIRAWPVSHTDNDLTVFDVTSATLFSGDLVFLDHLPSVDGSLLGWLKTLDALAAIPARQVVPGHGPVPSPWPAAMDPERRYFAILARDIRAALAENLPLSEAIGTIGESERGAWSLFDEFNKRNATAAFAELEWE